MRIVRTKYGSRTDSIIKFYTKQSFLNYIEYWWVASIYTSDSNLVYSAISEVSMNTMTTILDRFLGKKIPMGTSL